MEFPERATFIEQVKANAKGERLRAEVEVESSSADHAHAHCMTWRARAEKAEAERDAAREALARVEALVNDEGRSDVAFGSRPFRPRGMSSPVLHLNDVRRALQSATDEGAGAARNATLLADFGV